MSQARLLAPKSWDRAFYHCVSRVVDRRFIFGDEEHVEFLRLMNIVHPAALAIHADARSMALLQVLPGFGGELTEAP